MIAIKKNMNHSRQTFDSVWYSSATQWILREMRHFMDWYKIETYLGTWDWLQSCILEIKSNYFK